MQFLFAVMELMIQDISITKVAEELNRRGFQDTRRECVGAGGGF